jgi:alkylhydroperoxidase family enzyme
LVQQGVDDDLYVHVAEWRTWPGYTDRERLAIEYAERFAVDHDGIDDAFFARLRARFADDEILDLSICLSTFLGLGRLLKVLGIDERCDVGLPRDQPEGPRP